MIHGRPESVDKGIVFCRYEVLAICQELPGCVGLSMIVDRESGRSITTTAWDSIKSMHASAIQMRPVRGAAAKTLGGAPEVTEWEIAVILTSAANPASGTRSRPKMQLSGVRLPPRRPSA
jgi:hypothetical protein